MFVFGHLGVGRALVSRWKREHSVWWLALGTLLPDLIDKPLYYSRLSESFFSCTRTVGHTGLLVLIVFAIGRLTRRRAATTVAIGMTTHLILDCLMDVIGGDHAHFGPGAAIIAAAWPLLGHFASVHFASVPEHLESLLTVPIVVSEIVGLGLLMWEWRRTARRAAIDERR